MTNTSQRSPEQITGEKIFSWTALSYHPHNRGIVWYVVFCILFFGSAIWALVKGDFMMAFSLFIAVSVYFFVHRKGDEEHEIHVFEKGILVDRKYFPMEKLEGYWFLSDSTVNVLNLQLEGKGNRKISLQMGNKEADDFRSEFKNTTLSELPDKKESLLDLWIRALKL
jgi:hypothetical protein